jgi:hypothetical protein
MDQEILGKMMARVERCRLLARKTSDDRVARALAQIADEGQTDIEQLFAQVKRGARHRA